MASIKKKILRPRIAKPSISLDKFVNQTSRDGLISQDILITRYLEELALQKTRSKLKVRPPESFIQKSPYASSSIILSGDNSTEVGIRRLSKNLSTSTLQPHPPRKKRPVSAPVYRLGTGSWSAFDDLNASYSASMISSVSSRSSHKKPVYKRKHRILCVQAFPNGSREYSARVTAQDLMQLLAECTSKLSLTSAARRLYLPDGIQVVDQKQLTKDCEVYVSMGEAFKDPFLNLQEREKLQKTSFWTLNGIMNSGHDKKPKVVSSSLSHRIMDLMDSQRKRILVFKNGESFGGVEVIAHRFDEFLDECTQKLHLSSGARSLYDWNGKIVERFSQVPCLDKVLQPSNGTVLGPLWVTKGGEVFSPKGSHDFLSTMISNTKERIKESKQYIEALENQLQQPDNGELFSVIEVGTELDEELKILTELEFVLPILTKNLKKINRPYQKEELMTSSVYKFKNISEIDSNSRLLGLQGIKLQLYTNGSNLNVEPIKVFINIGLIQKGAKTNQEILERFFEFLSYNDNVSAKFASGKMIFIKRAFKIDGTEITDVGMLESNDQIWLSCGESFIPVYYTVVTLTLDKVKVMNLWGLKEIIQKDLWMGADENQTKAKLWQPISSIPSQCERMEMKIEMTAEQKLSYNKQCTDNYLRSDVTFLQSRQNHSLVLYPEISFVLKGDGTDSDLWGDAIQHWCVTQDGFICNKHFKNLALGILDRQVEMTLVDDGEEELLDGAAVGLLLKNDPSNQNNCLWVFTSDGYIQSAMNPGYVLTAVQDFSLNKHEQEVVEPLLKVPSQTWEISNTQVDNESIVVTEHHSDNESSSSSSSSSSDGEQKENKGKKKKKKSKRKKVEEQAEITSEEKKQIPEIVEKEINPFEGIKDVYDGESLSLVVLPRFPEKHSLASKQRWAIKTSQPVESNITEKWSRQNLFWPVDRSETYLETSVDGLLSYNAPKLKWKVGKTQATKSEVPVKLLVMRNGETDITRAVKVVGPDLRTMKKDISIPSRSNGVMERLTALDVEFFQFLESCTTALSLRFAARKLFNKEGKEVFSLNDFKKNDLVYVSCGENWVNPSSSHADNQKRLLLANLSSDINKIRYFTALRMQTGFIIGVENNDLSVGRKLILMQRPENEMEYIEQRMDNDKEKKIDEIFQAEARLQTENEERVLTAHQRAHLKQEQEERKEMSLNISSSDEINETISHREALLSSNSPTKKPCSYKWIYSDEFISLESNPNLVVGCHESEINANADLIICQKKLEDPYQRWLMCDDGTICLKGNPSRVISVTSNVNQLSYDGIKLILTSKKYQFNGNSHQLFYHDLNSGFVHAFAADNINKDLSAAIKSGICTYAVFGPTEVYQPGYVWHRQEVNGNVTSLHFCDACGKSIRGIQKLQTLNRIVEFSCASGEAKRHKLKFTGALTHLNGKVDLSPRECEATLALWEMQLQRLREESSARAIASELTMVQSNPAVRVLAHKNGDTSSEGALLIGNMISQILDMCTIKLNLTKAARRLYSINGDIITDMQQLLKPYYPELTYMKQSHQAKSSSGKQLQQDQLDEDPFFIEKLDVRVPVDVWVSTGEAFIPLDEIEKVHILSKYENSEKNETRNSLELEKHRLRQTKGRRLSGRNSDRNIKPVLIKDYLSDCKNEDDIEESIHQLKTQLKEVKSQQETRAKGLKIKKSSSTRLSDKLKNLKVYQIPQAIKLYIFPNGENPERSDVIHARTFQEVLDNATNKLGLTSCARRAFSVQGTEIFTMEDLERNQVICLTCGEKFVPHKDRRNQMEIRASWSRAHRKTPVDKNNNAVVSEVTQSIRSPLLALPSSTNGKHLTKNDVYVHEIDQVKQPGRSILSQRPKSAKVLIS